MCGSVGDAMKVKHRIDGNNVNENFVVKLPVACVSKVYRSLMLLV